MSGVWEELKRRRVVRVAGVYAVAAFAVLQVGDLVVDPLRLPSWTMPLLIVLAAIGFPVAVALAWAFDVTPAGVSRDRGPDALTEGEREGGPAEEGRAEVAGGTAPRPPHPPRPPRPARRRIAVAAGAVTVALGGGVLLAVRPAAPGLVTNRVVVDVFENRTGEPELDAVGQMAADWVIRALQRTSSLEVIPLEAARVRDVAGGAAGEGSRGRGRALGAEFGARLVVSGSYYLEGDSLRILAGVTDAADGDLLFTTDPVSAPRGVPSDGLDALQQAVAGFVAVWGDWSEIGHGAAVTVASPPSYDAYREYAAGSEIFVRGDYRAALPYLHRAVDLDSTFVTAISRAAIAHSNVGEYAAAEPFIALLGRLRERMTPYERLQADWVVATQRGDLEAALDAARAAQALAPVPTWHYLVALYALRLNRPTEAIEALDSIDRDGYVARAWRPFWSVLCQAYHLAGDYDAELEALRAAREKHRDYGPGIEIRALVGLGQLDAARAKIEALTTRFPSTAGSTLVSAARELRAHGHEVAAREAAELAVAWQQSHDPADSLAAARALYLAGNFDEAIERLEPLRAAGEAHPELLGTLGAAAARLDERPTAEALAAELAGLDTRYLFGEDSYQRARIAALLGDTAAAVRLLRQAFAEGYRLSAVHDDPDLMVLRGDPAFEAAIASYAGAFGS